MSCRLHLGASRGADHGLHCGRPRHLSSSPVAATYRRIQGWTPSIIKHLVNRAVRRLPEEERSRFEEEWLAHVNELPGEVAKIIAALGFLSAAPRMSLRISVAKRVLDVGVSIILLLWMAPVMLPIALIIKVQDSGPISIKRDQKVNGKTVAVFKFRTEDIAGRRTPFGQFLKRRNLDELPTLLNVVYGDMTMSGLKEWFRIV